MQAPLPKQYLPLLGRPVILHTLERLAGYVHISGVLVGVSARDAHWATVARDAASLPKLLGTFEGGATRAHTVLNGLEALAAHAQPTDWVMVHDAVRPCIRHADLDKLVETVRDYPDGGLLALPMSDTVKRAELDGRVIETVPRAGLWRAMTPQMFHLDDLKLALARALRDGVEVTDEAAAMERAGRRPRVVAGHPDNVKITLPSDLPLAELFLGRQQSEA